MEIKVDKNIYSKQVLLKTAYSFSDRVYLHLSQDSESWIVQWTDMPDQKIEAQMFENELLSQQLREELIEKTRNIRELLLSRAFASSALMIDDSDRGILGNEKVNDLQDATEVDGASILKDWFDR